ncbi:MAG: hypothetical protein ACREJM_15045, partial [Candidatus Saccharimonadales bacterium]
MSESQGRNWHIERGFLSREQARRAESGAVVLKSLRPSYVRGFEPPNKDRQRGELVVLRVAFREMSDSDRETFAGLIDVAHAVNRAADAMAGREREPEEEIFLNFYRPGASTSEHKDRQTDTTVA